MGVQELIDSLGRKKLEVRRLQTALGTDLCQLDSASDASTAPSTEVAEVACEPATLPFVEGQSILVEFDAELFDATIQCQNPDGSFHVIYDVDGTWEDVDVERIQEMSLAEGHAAATTGDVPASAELSGVSKKAKARARKQKSDAAKAAAPTQTMPAKVETSIVAVQKVVESPANASKARADVSQNVWYESKDGCKTHATRVVPRDRIGWIIGKEGAKLKEMKEKYGADVRIDASDVIVSGKHERVKNAMNYIDWIISQESYSRPEKPRLSGPAAKWKAGQRLANLTARQYQSSRK